MSESAADFAARHRKVVTLRDGTSIEVRPITPGDAETLRSGFDKLSAESRWRRFLRPVPRLSDREIRYFTDIDYVDHFAWGAQTTERKPDGIGVARFVRDRDDPSVAELAIVVADEWQGRGVGTLLLELLVLSAEERGIETFRGFVASSNDGARRLLTGLGARGHYAEGMWVAELHLPSSSSAIRGTPLHEALTAAASGKVEFRAHKARRLLSKILNVFGRFRR